MAMLHKGGLRGHFEKYELEYIAHFRNFLWYGNWLYLRICVGLTPP